MRQQRSLPRRGMALALAFFMTLSPVWAAAGDQKLQTTTELVEGLTYQNTITENGGNRVESFSFALSPDSKARAILLQGDETIYGGGSITKVIANAQAQGYHVLGAVNTDFFAVATGVPMGLVIEDGVYKSNSYLENALVIGPEGISIVEDPQVSLTLYNHTNGLTVTPTHFNKTRNSGGGMYLLNSDFSTVSTRSDGPGWYIRLKRTDGEPPAQPAPSEPLTTEPAVEPTGSPEEPPYTAEEGEAIPSASVPAPEEGPETSTGTDLPDTGEGDGSPETTPLPAELPDETPTTMPEPTPEGSADFPSKPEDEVDGKLRVNSALHFVVTEVIRSDKSLPMAPDEYVLTAVDGYREDIFASFQVGDWITLNTSCDDRALSNAQWACGVGDIMVKDGVLTDSANWTYAKDGRQPRTAMGLKPDGTLVLYAVDGRQSGYSAGLTQMDLATELQRQGCTWVANLDGGGSTALAAWIPGREAVAVQNKPSDGSQRRCATYLLLVTEAGDGTPDRLAYTQEGQTVLAGSAFTLPQAVAVDSGLGISPADFSGFTVTSGNGLGQVDEGIYTAGPFAGTDTLLLQAGELTGSAQIHVVDHLTQMQLGRAGTNGGLNSLRVLTGARVDMTLSGSYWSREALRGFGAEEWSVEGDVGSVDETGRFVAALRPAEGSITCTVGGLSQTVHVTVVDRHEDIQPDHWAYDAVEYCYEKGIVGGESLTKFGRDNPIRRGDFIQMLYNTVGRPSVEGACTFLDVPRDAYYYQAISWAQGLGLATGMGDGNFAPGDPVTREQAFTLLYRFLLSQDVELPEGDMTILNAFADGETVLDYAKFPTATLIGCGLVGGNNKGLSPRDTLTRAEMATLMCRVVEYAPDTLLANVDNEPGIPGAVDAPEPEPELPVEPEPAARIGYVAGISTFLKVRTGPGSDFDVVGKLLEGDTVEVVEELEGWYIIRFSSGAGNLGYVSADYITFDVNTNAE